MEYKKLNVNGGGKLYLHSFYSGKDGATIGGNLSGLHFISFQLISPQKEKFGSGKNVVDFLVKKGFTDIRHFAPASGCYYDIDDRTYINLIGIFAYNSTNLQIVPYHYQNGIGYAFNFSQSNMSEYVTEL